MKNMKISAKLIVSFLIVAILAAVVGVVGIVGMTQISAADTGLYENNLIAVQAMGDIQYNISALRMHNRNVVLYDAEDATFKTSDQTITNIMNQMPALFDAYQATIADSNDQATFDKIKSLYNDVLINQIIIPAVAAGRVNDNETAQALMDAGAAQINELNQLLIDSVQYNANEAETVVHNNQALSTTMTVLMIAVLIVAVAVAMALGLYISNLISKPTKTLSDMMNNLVKTGNFRLDAADVAKVNEYGKSKDETGVTANAFSALMNMMLAKCDTLETVAGGDLTAEVEHISEKDTIGNAMQKMVDSLNKMFAEINSSSNQVSTGSVQIADGAQLLAQGATEQSATVEQLSASVTQVAAQTKDNASTAGEARDLAESIKTSAEQGSRQMEQMMQAVAEINESSKSIGKVIKIIDDIAFQTNILALNAAVEAARAGQHGKGFAVVADEVRSLAAKSAEAAKNTNELIESSIQKAEQGASISAETSESLNQIVEGILKSTELVSNIAKSSNEQSIAISQIGEAIDQVSQVVQQNSATAEESAAASEEMSGQATLLQQLIAQFKIKGASSGGYTPSAAPAPARVSSISSPASSGFAMDGGSKY